ncbi:MAG: MarR family transcriptional regulator [Actinomycetota bacterium]|nr:MarR family transcriptional regulator [Actinomycetota bacterium]
MSSVNPEHVFTLLDRALRALRDDMGVRMEQASVDELRSSQRRLLSMVPDEGIRVTDLANEAGMTAQSLGEFARELERLGLVEFGRDANDGRVRLISLTPRGRRIEREGDAVIRAMEADWRARLGADDWDRMCAVLARIADGA